MKIVFLSNYFTHHQQPLSQALAARTDYTFIATAEMPRERREQGWELDGEPDYVCHYDLEKERAEARLARADAVIAGSAPEALVRRCIRRGQLVFRYSERPLKNGSEVGKYLPRLLKWHWQNPAEKPIYLLCSSAYTAGDFARFGLFRGKAFRWGYFPEVRQYGDLPDKKPVSILWAGRFLNWKHPDDAVRVAARLKAEGLDFQMDLIGGGPMERTLRGMIAQERLEDCVHLLGTMKPGEVRRHMERSQIFLFTSDRREGWGAVLNEAMNSGCAVVASDAIGAVPYLLQDGENGYIYPSGDLETLFRRVKELLANPQHAKRLGRSAYEAITQVWNADCAAGRLVCLLEKMLAGEDPLGGYPDGPCSPAPIIREDWFKK